MPLEELLTQISQRADLPFDEAVALPPEAYLSQDLYELERQNIFRKEWICVARVDQFSTAGDYIASDVAGEPILTILNNAGEIRSFANVCQHRGTKLLEGSGNARRIVCPYHAWTYSADDGRLMNATQMEQSKAHDPSKSGLKALRTEVWLGWVFVTLNSDQEPLCERLKGLSEHVKHYGMQHYRTVVQVDMPCSTNWKCMTENFIDEYHPFMVHRNTLAARPTAMSMTDVQFRSHGAENHVWALHAESVHEDTTRIAKQLFPDMPEKESTWTVLWGTFPGHTVFIGPGKLMFSLMIHPLSHSQLNVRWTIGAPPGFTELTGETDEQIIEFYHRVNSEDKVIVEKVFKGLQSTHARSGALSYREVSLWRFQKFLQQRLCF